jgi:hypothetical protein
LTIKAGGDSASVICGITVFPGEGTFYACGRRREFLMDENPLNAFGEVVWVALGALLGVNGIVIGLMFAKDFRKYRGFVTVNAYVWKYLGILGVGIGGVLLYAGYSHDAWYPCVLLGMVLLVCALLLRNVVRHRVQKIEESYLRPRNKRLPDR